MFIFVYRLAIDAKTRKGDGVAGGKCLSLLKDFQTGTASMARKRHLHRAQGVFYVFVLHPPHDLSVLSVISVKIRVEEE